MVLIVLHKICLTTAYNHRGQVLHLLECKLQVVVSLNNTPEPLIL